MTSFFHKTVIHKNEKRYAHISAMRSADLRVEDENTTTPLEIAGGFAVEDEKLSNVFGL